MWNELFLRSILNKGNWISFVHYKREDSTAVLDDFKNISRTALEDKNWTVIMILCNMCDFIWKINGLFIKSMFCGYYVELQNIFALDTGI